MTEDGASCRTDDSTGDILTESLHEKVSESMSEHDMDGLVVVVSVSTSVHTSVVSGAVVITSVHSSVIETLADSVVVSVQVGPIVETTDSEIDSEHEGCPPAGTVQTVTETVSVFMVGPIEQEIVDTVADEVTEWVSQD